MSTNVPRPAFSDAGFVAPSESDVLAGVQADQQTAFGGTLNPHLTSPQGQLAQSVAAIVGDCNDQFVALVNAVDPAYASGRMQDAIGRIYFLDRIAASSTVVTALCSGLTNTVIPAGALAQDTSGNLYASLAPETIPTGGSIAVVFECQTTGPIACPPSALSKVYRAVPGWDSVTNPVAGVLGSDVETRADFEYRRQQSVAANATGSNAAILGAVLQVAGVLDAWVIDNPLSAVSDATFTGSISGTTLTASGASGGKIMVGHMLTGAGVVSGTSITSYMSGAGGNGTYGISLAQTVASEAMSTNFGGVSLAPHSIYVSVYGGAAADIGAAILQHKNPGCDYNGNTTVVVPDKSSLYVAPYPAYAVTYETPAPTPILVSVQMQAGSNVPNNATQLVQNALISAFTGADGGSRARIAGTIFASRFYAGIAALGSWALIYSIQVGIGSATHNSVLMRGDQVPTITASGITVTFS